MTPSELDAFLTVMHKHKVGAAVLKTGGDTLQVSFMPDLPEFKGTEPTPGGWKSPNHLDNPDRIDPAALNGREYGVEQLP